MKKIQFWKTGDAADQKERVEGIFKNQNLQIHKRVLRYFEYFMLMFHYMSFNYFVPEIV